MEFSRQTQSRIKAYFSKGWTILIGNNPDLSKRRKWRNHDCVRLCLTNSKIHGWPIRTVWAVRPIVEGSPPRNPEGGALFIDSNGAECTPWNGHTLPGETRSESWDRWACGEEQ